MGTANLPVNQDLVARLLKCALGAKDRGFMLSLLGRQTVSQAQFNWLHGLAARHKKKLSALKAQG